MTNRQIIWWGLNGGGARGFAKGGRLVFTVDLE